MNRRLLIYSIFFIFIIFTICFLVFYENCEANAQYPIIGREPGEEQVMHDILPPEKVKEPIDAPC